MLSKPLQITPFKSHEVRDGKKMKVDFFLQENHKLKGKQFAVIIVML